MTAFHVVDPVEKSEVILEARSEHAARIWISQRVKVTPITLKEVLALAAKGVPVKRVDDPTNKQQAEIF